MKTRSCLTLSFFFLASLLHAQAWTNVGIGGGGAQFAPSYSPLDSNLVFLQCDMGGIYRSANGGTNFTMVDFIQFGSQTDYPNGSCPIAYDPNNANNLWAFGMQADDVSGSLLKSTDEGVHWSYAAPQPPAGTWTRINQIVLDRGDSNFILLGTDTGAYRTTNGGGTWTVCPTVTGYVWGIVIDQSSAVGNRICYIGSSTGVFKSVNEGAAWAAANTGLPGPVSLTGFSGASTSAPATVVLYAVYDPTGNGTYFGTDIYRSVNGAANWTLALAAGSSDGFNKVECAEGSPATAYALNNDQSGTVNEEIWKTTDYGATWNNVFTPGFGSGNVTLGWCDWDITFQEGAAWIQLKVDPANTNRVVATDLDCTYMTTNGGTTWNQIYSTFSDINPIAAGKKWNSRGLEVTTAWHYYISPWSSTTHYLCQSDIGIQRSTDSGNTWYHSIPFSTPWHNSIYELAFDTGTQTIYAAASNQHDIPHSTQIGRAPTTGGVLRSQNNGVTWGSMSTGLPGTPATSILRDGAGNLYVAIWGNSTANGGVFKSTNGGTSWAAINTGLGNGANFHAYQLKMDAGGNLYCLISGYTVGGPWVAGGIWKSTNGGASWNYLTANGDGAGVPLYYLQGFDVDSTGTTIYAASMKWGSPTQKGLYRSTNGGTSWTHMVTIFPATANNIDGFCPSIDPANSSHVYLGTENQGLWESFDAGTNWARVTGIPFRNIHRVEFDTANNTLYATTFGSSVWKLATGSTPTPTPSSTPTSTPSGANTPTNSPTKTPTNTPTNSPSNSPTRTPTVSATATPTSSPTLTLTLSASPTPTLTPTLTATRTPTLSHTPSLTNSPTSSPTVTPTRTPTATPTLSSTNSPTRTPSSTATNTATSSATNTGTLPPTNTATSTPTLSPTPTPTSSPTLTTTNSPTDTPTNTWTFPALPPTFTSTPTPSATPTFTPTATSTPTNTPTTATSPVTKIACVGDSLTTGYPGPGSQSYPSVLGTLLGPNYQVQNDGLFGATLSQSGLPSFWNSQPFTDSQNDLPNIVVICLGTNDLQTGNWPGSASFSADLAALITMYQNLASHPTVYVCLPPWISQDFNGANDSLLTSLEIPLILQTAAQKNACVIDLHSTTLNQAGWYVDGVHQTATGYAAMAGKVDCVLTGNCPCGMPTPTFTPGPVAVGTPLPIPNPVTLPGTTQILVSLGQPAKSLSLSLFTTAFRKVNEMSYSNLPAGGVMLSMPTRDKDGADLANGLYYLAVKTDRGHAVGKMLIER